MSCNSFLGNRMVRFSILNCLVFLTRGTYVLLVADVSITAISYVVASLVKTLSRS
jgi:hypothetical protein